MGGVVFQSHDVTLKMEDEMKPFEKLGEEESRKVCNARTIRIFSSVQAYSSQFVLHSKFNLRSFFIL